MILFRNSGGSHTCLDGSIVGPGKTIVTDEELDRKFPDKFTRVPSVPPPPEPTPALPIVTPVPATVTPVPAPVSLVDMVDETAKFPEASASGLMVLSDKRGFWVYDEKEKEPINEKPLKKTAVTKFISEVL